VRAGTTAAGIVTGPWRAVPYPAGDVRSPRPVPGSHGRGFFSYSVADEVC